MQLHMYKNSNHQVVLPVDGVGESTRADLCRTYCMVAAACPLQTSSASRGQGVLSTKELFKVMLSNIRWGLSFRNYKHTYQGHWGQVHHAEKVMTVQLPRVCCYLCMHAQFSPAVLPHVRFLLEDTTRMHT